MDVVITNKPEGCLNFKNIGNLWGKIKNIIKDVNSDVTDHDYIG